MLVNTINKKPYLSKIDEFTKYQHNEYNYLQIFPIVGILERHLGLLKDIASDVFQNKCNLTIIGNTHGGFLPLNAAEHFKNVHVDYFELNSQNTIVYVSPSFTLPYNILEHILHIYTYTRQSIRQYTRQYTGHTHIIDNLLYDILDNILDNIYIYTRQSIRQYTRQYSTHIYIY